MKKLEFKGEKYNLLQLIGYHYDVGLKEFKDGEVIDTSTGEVIFINNLFDVYKENIKELLNNSRNFSSHKEQYKIKSIYEKQIKEIKLKQLNSRLEDNTITLKEIEEWLTLMPYKERLSFGIAKYSNFITINHAKPKPKDMSRNDYSRLFNLIYIMNYKNKI